MIQTVFFSDQLPKKFKVEWNTIKYVLQSRNIDVQLIHGTKDIWCRDYMPVKNSKGELIQFRYEPSYLKDYLHLKSDPKEVLKANNLKARYSSINLDGGNVIMSGNRAIITDRVVLENPEYSNKFRLYKEIEELLEVDLIVMPCYPPKYDMTGHIDGMMRFVDENTLISNDLKNEDPELVNNIRSILNDQGLEYIPMPFYQDKSTPISAIGIYVNYLELDDLILFPIFNQKDYIDSRAIDTIIKAFPNKEIVPININAVAREGGLMNCISWVV